MSETPHITLAGENLQSLATATLTHFVMGTAIVGINPPALTQLPRMQTVRDIEFTCMNLRNLTLPPAMVEKELGIGTHMSTRYLNKIFDMLPAVPAHNALPRFLFDIGYYNLYTKLPSLNLSSEEYTTVDMLTRGYTQPMIDNTIEASVSTHGQIQNIIRRTKLHGAPNIIWAALLSDAFGVYLQEQQQMSFPLEPEPSTANVLQTSLPESLHFILPPEILDL